MKHSALVFCLLFTSCISIKPAPEWVFTQPSAEKFWFGVGNVKKPYYGTNIREEARNKAIEEISSQISVDISASFERVVREHNLQLEDYSKSIVQTRVENSLPHIEILDFYESKDRYYLLARLSQEKYYQSITQQRENAVQLVISLLEQAQKEESAHSFLLIGEAASEILPYIDYPIEVEFPKGSGQRVNLYSHIKLMALQQMQDIQLIPNAKEIEITAGFSKGEEVSVLVSQSDESTPVKGLPLRISLKNSSEFISALTDENGKVIFPIPKLEDKGSIQYIEISVDISELFGINLFTHISAIKEEIILRVVPPQIAIHLTELKLEAENSNPFVQPVITDFFSRELGAVFTEGNDSDLRISGEVRTWKSAETPAVVSGVEMFQVSCNATIRLYHGKTGEELLAKSYSLNKVIDYYSFEEAANKALIQVSEQIQAEFLPEFLQTLQQ
ncbi:MAG: LPP20 family lipoprotein [Candidatus Marinimicrobia bacterium]|nr:LPP20 family lipoprotein [Candidatus Neomarinimicrobiota bacterium]